MVKICRKPDVKDLWVSSHDRLSDFYASSWQPGETPVPLLMVRLVGLVLATAILLWALVEGRNIYWLVFLTNWGLLFVTSMFLSGVVVSLMAVCKKLPEEGSDLPWYVCTFWLLHNIAVSLSLLITALYWVLLYSPETKDILGLRLFTLDMLTHAANSLLVMIELLASRTPVRLLHIYQPLGVGLWYGAFTVIFYLAGGTNGLGEPYIYEIMDWRQSKRSSIVVALSAAVLIFIYLVVFVVALCRDKLTGFLFRTTSIKLAFVPPDLPEFP